MWRFYRLFNTPVSLVVLAFTTKGKTNYYVVYYGMSRTRPHDPGHQNPGNSRAIDWMEEKKRENETENGSWKIAGGKKLDILMARLWI